MKTILAKGAPKTGQHGCGRGRGAPSAHGRGAAPTGTHATEIFSYIVCHSS